MDFWNLFRLSSSGFQTCGLNLSPQSRHGSAKPPEVLPGASSRLPAADSSTGPGAGVAAPGDLPGVSPPLDAE